MEFDWERDLSDKTHHGVTFALFRTIAENCGKYWKVEESGLVFSVETDIRSNLPG